MSRPWTRDWFAESERIRERIKREVAEEGRRRQADEAATAERRQLAEMTAGIARGDVAAMDRHIEWIARRHDIRRFVQPGIFSANKPYRYVVGPAIRTITDYSAWLHELSHVIAEPCRGGLHDPHYVENNRYVNCIRCEDLAWRGALELTLVPFTPAMFEHLRRSVRSYRHTPAPAAAIRDLEATSGSVRFAEHRQTRINRDWRLEKQAAANASVERDRQRQRDEEMAQIRAFSDRVLARMGRSF
jgi:hypothetical protein